MVTKNTTETSLVPASENITGFGSTKQFRIPGDVIRGAAAHLPKEQQNTLLWFGEYCRKRNLGKAELGTILRKGSGAFYSYDSIHQTLTGKRMREGTNVDAMIESIAKLMEIEMAREAQQSTGYIHTRLADEIWKRCRKALLRNRITFIFGDSQIGKTWALKEYKKQHNHGETIYMEVPTGANLGSCLIEIAEALGIPTQLRQAELRRRIIAAFDDKMLLIVDEAHRCFNSRYGNSGLQLFDFLRLLWNKTKCGIVISLTNEGRDEFLKGRHAKALQQLWRRRITPLQLPAYPPEDDLALFADSFGLEPANDVNIRVNMEYTDDHGKCRKISHTNNPLQLQTDIVRNEGLGVWITILEDAADMAEDAGRQLSWGAVIKAYCLSQAEAEMIK